MTHRIIGCGGMAIVYEATSRRTSERLALKVSLGSLTGEELERFQQEAAIGRRLCHAGIPAIRGSGRFPGGAWIAMEYAEGSCLDQRLQDLSLTATERLEILIQLAEILDHAHSRGIVHRDIKPGNVLLGPGGVKLLDFGIAKLSDVHLTRPGVLVGTPSYMAPEQLAGQPIDHRTDLFQLGVLAFELFGTRRPWSGDHPVRMAWAVCNESPARLAECARPDLFVAEEALLLLEATIMRTLARNPEDRPSSGGELATELRAIAPRFTEPAEVRFAPPVWSELESLVVLGPNSLSRYLPPCRETHFATSAREAIARLLASMEPRVVIDCATVGLEAIEEILDALSCWGKAASVALICNDGDMAIPFEHTGLRVRLLGHDALRELPEWLLGV